jgi:histidine triad (HIT) family protein
METTIFHKFATGELRPDTVRYEDDEMIAFDDIRPSAAVHVLIIPKKEIISVADMEPGDELIVGKLVYRAKLLAEELGIDHPGYRVSFNVREGGGQVIPYLHLHLMGGPHPWRDLQ